MRVANLAGDQRQSGRDQTVGRQSLAEHGPNQYRMPNHIWPRAPQRTPHTANANASANGVLHKLHTQHTKRVWQQQPQLHSGIRRVALKVMEGGPLKADTTPRYASNSASLAGAQQRQDNVKDTSSRDGLLEAAIDARSRCRVSVGRNST
ncbi:hypothetical protein ACLKA7_001731 [Drosophila subpalustris]